MITILAIWKILTPAYLKGANPIWWGIVLTAFLTLLIIFLVYVFDKKTLAASSGALLGVLVSCVMGCIFTDAFKIHGAVMAYSESLLYAGYQSLNLSQIYMSGIFIGASGAMMDLSVDITSAVNEVIGKKPEIKYRSTVQKEEELVILQRNILDKAAEYVKPRGVLIFSTCTVAKEENEENMMWFMNNHPFKLESIDEFVPDELKSETTSLGYLQLLPGVHGTDGFFMAKFRRK